MRRAFWDGLNWLNRSIHTAYNRQWRAGEKGRQLWQLACADIRTTEG